MSACFLLWKRYLIVITYLACLSCLPVAVEIPILVDTKQILAVLNSERQKKNKQAKQNKTKQNKTKQNKTKTKNKIKKQKQKQKRKLKWKQKKKKNKKKRSSPHFVTFPPSIFNFPHSLFWFSFFSAPFSLFSMPLFPVGQQKFSGQKSRGGALCPLPPAPCPPPVTPLCTAPKIHCPSDNTHSVIIIKPFKIPPYSIKNQLWHSALLNEFSGSNLTYWLVKKV